MPAEDILYEELMYAFETYDNYVANLEAQRVPIITNTVNSDGSITESVEYVYEGKVLDALKGAGNKILEGAKWLIHKVAEFFKRIGSWIKNKIHRVKASDTDKTTKVVAEVVTGKYIIPELYEDYMKVRSGEIKTKVEVKLGNLPEPVKEKVQSAVDDYMQSSRAQALMGALDKYSSELGGDTKISVSLDGIKDIVKQTDTTTLSEPEFQEVKEVVAEIKNPNTDFVKFIKEAKSSYGRSNVRTSVLMKMIFNAVRWQYVSIDDFVSGNNAKIREAILKETKDYANISPELKKSRKLTGTMILGDFSDKAVKEASAYQYFKTRTKHRPSATSDDCLKKNRDKPVDNTIKQLLNTPSDKLTEDNMDEIGYYLSGYDLTTTMAGTLSGKDIDSFNSSPNIQNIVIFPTGEGVIIFKGSRFRFELNNVDSSSAMNFGNAIKNPTVINFVNYINDDYLKTASEIISRFSSVLPEKVIVRHNSRLIPMIQKLCQDFMTIATTLAESTWVFEM